MLNTKISNKKKISQLFSTLVILSVITTTLLSFLDYYNFFGISRDRENYNLFFNFLTKNSIEDSLDTFTHEIGFQYLTSLLIGLGIPSDALYPFEIGLSLLPKLLVLVIIICKCIDKKQQSMQGANFILAVSIYICKFFPLHELTQLRASLSCACLYVATLFLVSEDSIVIFKSRDAKFNKKSVKILTWIIYILSISFHYSAIAAIMVIITATCVKSLRSAIITSIFVYLGSLLTTFGLLLSPIIKGIFLKADTFSYEDLTSINLFSPQRILDIILVLSIIFIIDRKSSIQLFSFTIFLYSLAVFYGTSAAPVYAHRLTELLQSLGLMFLVASANKILLIRLTPLIILNIILSLLVFVTQDYFSQF